MRKPSRICIEVGCNVSTTGSRCERHEAERVQRRNQADPRQSVEFRKAKAAVRSRDEFCQHCFRKPPFVKRLDVHHVNGDRGDHRLANLVLLCDDCHLEADRLMGIRR